MNNLEIYSKESKSTNENIDIFTLLINLGLSPSLKGTFFLKAIIKICLDRPYLKELSFKEIVSIYSKENNLTPKNVISSIQYACHSINQNHAKKNFRKYLDIDYDEYFLSKKQFLLILNNKIK